MGDDLDAWAEATDRLASLGRRLGDDDYPGVEADRADGVAHVVEQALCWMGWSVFHADPRRPTFQRQNDLITQWGGPNADNVYRHARVEPGRRYRIRGRMHSCEEFILAVRAGFMHLPTWGTLLEVTASELGIGEGDEFDFEVGRGRGGPAARRAPSPCRSVSTTSTGGRPSRPPSPSSASTPTPQIRPAAAPRRRRRRSYGKASTASPTRWSTGTPTCARSAARACPTSSTRPSPSTKASTPPGTPSASGISDRTRRSSSR